MIPSAEISTPSLRLVPAGEKSATAQAYFQAAPPRVRKWLLWDIPDEEQKASLFPRVCQQATLWLAETDGQPLALAWFVPLSPAATCACPHFSFIRTTPQGALALGRRVLVQAGGLYQSLIALVPVRLFGARRLARALGFTPHCLLPGICAPGGRAAELMTYHYHQPDQPACA